MTRLDEISTAIGELREGQRQAERDRERMRETMEQLDESVRALAGTVSTATRTIADMQPQVEWSRRTRWIGLGILLAVGTLGGIIGSKIQGLFAMINGGGN